MEKAFGGLDGHLQDLMSLYNLVWAELVLHIITNEYSSALLYYSFKV